MGIQARPSSNKPSGVPKAKAKQDEAIIGTNDYSIVSKRSVEKLYLSDEPEFLRAFVHKYKRRAPLINRGYWLRMKAIEAVVRCFLNEDTDKSKVIVNVGCGYEPLPFRIMWKYPEECRDVRFVDVDFPQLVEKKLEIIRSEPVFQDYLKSSTVKQPSHAAVLFESDNYSAVGCDLGNHDQIRRVLNDQLNPGRHSILFIGEVSIVYMPPQEATDFFQICSTFPDARFCLLEQHLPVGDSHPFVRTMINHFNKQTPLRGLPAFKTIQAQKDRILGAGWHDVQATDLWSLWQNQHFLEDRERIALDRVEPFDEWEGLALFAGHYFLLLANTAAAQDSTASWKRTLILTEANKTQPQAKATVSINATEIPKGYGRVNGAILGVNEDSFVHCGGAVNSARQEVGDIYTTSEFVPSSTPFPLATLSCHTITSLNNGSSLLVGGRTSPLRASSRCYLLENGKWAPVADLQPGRYRHCAASICVNGKHGVIVFGGRTGNSEALDHWSLFIDHQWHRLPVKGDQPPALFGAAIAATSFTSGVLFGGLQSNGRLRLEDGTIGFWRWNLKAGSNESMEMHVDFVPISELRDAMPRSIQRFGAVAVNTQLGVLLTGGIGPQGALNRNEELAILKHNGTLEFCEPLLNDDNSLPMFVGHAVAKSSGQDLLMVGGGTVCFSFGAFWNSNLYHLKLDGSKKSQEKRWQLMVASKNQPGATSKCTLKTSPVRGLGHSQLKGVQIPRLACFFEAAGDFHQTTANPMVIGAVELGPCVKLWSKDYLIEKVGSEKPTIIHSATSPHLSFHEKNFAYETVPFHSFITAAVAGSHVYMRALSTTKPSKSPASLATDYPALATDFIVPNELKFTEQHQHSSVLRISGNVNMWLHYDVMSNILCQVTGSKRIILFPPKDVSRLDFPAGETTSNRDVFMDDAGIFEGCSPVETTLSAGEVLFIPACWPHATAPAVEPKDSGLSVAVNVFFKSFDDKVYAAGRDVYGNRDLEMYQNGRTHVAKILGLLAESKTQDAVKNLEALAEKLRAKERVADDAFCGKEINRIIASATGVPDDIAIFYLARLADELVHGTRGS